MKLEEVEKYYLELRKYEYEKGVPLKGIELRRKIHPLLLSLIKIDRLLSNEELYVVGDKRVPTNRPKIYACTHIGGNDIQRVFEAIEEHAYLFISDLKELYVDETGLILSANGAIKSDSSNKLDRKIAFARSIELLKKGGNLLIFPEGVWNVSPNLLVLPLFDGVLKMADLTGADIIPIAVEQYANRFYVSIGENIPYDPILSGNIPNRKEELRDAMATLKWDIWSKVTNMTRAGITDQEIAEFQNSIIKRCEYDFSAQELERGVYRSKDIVTPEEAYIISPAQLYEIARGNYAALSDETLKDNKNHILLPKCVLPSGTDRQ